MDIESTNPEAEVETQTQGETLDTELENVGLEGEGEQEAPAIEEEEIELEGEKYKIPAKLKDKFMMQADYTRKTQEVASEKKTLEEQRVAFQREMETRQADFKAYADLTALEQQLSQWNDFDWLKANAEDPAEAQRLRFHYDSLRDAYSRRSQEIAQRQQQRAFEEQQTTAKRLEEANAVLSREIKGWSPELIGKLNDFGLQYGFSAQELTQAATDPRSIKLLHEAYIGRQLQQKAVQKPPAAQPQPTKTITTSGKSSPPSGLDDRLSTEEWIKRREQQVRKKRA